MKLSGYILKLIAMLTMLIDHVGLRFCNNARMMRLIGRTAMPIYAFFIADSVTYHKKKNTLKKQILKLLILAIVSEIPYDLFNSGTIYLPLKNNVIFTHLIGFLTCVFLHQNEGILWKLFVILMGGSVTECLHFDYGLIGVVLISGLYLSNEIKDNTKRKCITLSVLAVFAMYYVIGGANEFTIISVCDAFLRFTYSQLGVFISFPLICAYDRTLDSTYKINKNLWRYVYTSFYPLHLIILWLISII